MQYVDRMGGVVLLRWSQYNVSFQVHLNSKQLFGLVLSRTSHFLFLRLDTGASSHYCMKK